MAASVRVNSFKETVQVKNKSHLRQQLTACVCVKNYSGKCFQRVRYRDYENLSNQKTPLEYNKILNAYSIYFTPISELAGRSKVACGCNDTVKPNGEKLEINFY